MAVAVAEAEDEVFIEMGLKSGAAVLYQKKVIYSHNFKYSKRQRIHRDANEFTALRIYLITTDAT